LATRRVERGSPKGDKQAPMPAEKHVRITRCFLWVLGNGRATAISDKRHAVRITEMRLERSPNEAMRRKTNSLCPSLSISLMTKPQNGLLK